MNEKENKELSDFYYKIREYLNSEEMDFSNMHNENPHKHTAIAVRDKIDKFIFELYKKYR